MSSTLIISLILLIIIAIAVKSVIHRIRHGSACCGQRDAAPKKVKVSDKNKANYPFEYRMTIDGMHCSNCVRFVENAINSVEGLWAIVDLGKKEAHILAKNKMEQKYLEKIILDAGYTPLSFEIVKE
ncbi:MAG: cation transporter [Treponema sp.]|nr:cation transporter [Treponema sp.]